MKCWHGAVLVLIVATVWNIYFVLDSGNTLGIFNLLIDAPTYTAIARDVQQQGLGAIPLSQPPGFILYLAALKNLFSEIVLPAKLANVFFHSATACLVFFLALNYVGRYEAVIASVLTICSPMLRAYSAVLQYEVLSTLFNTAILAAAFAARLRHSLRLACAAGVLAGLGSLVREVTVLYIPVLAVFLIPHRRLVCLFLVSAIAPIAFWIMAQHHQHGTWALISTKGATNLELGYNPNATGTYHGTMRPVMEPKGEAFIKQYPLEALGLAWKKFLFFWGFESDGWNVPRRFSILLHQASLGLFDYRWPIAAARCGISILAMLGIAILIARGGLTREVGCIVALIGLTLCVYIALISSARFIVPILPLIYCMAAVTLSKIAHFLFARKIVPALMALVLLVLQFVSAPFHYNLEAEETDGFDVDNVPCDVCSDSSGRIVRAAQQKRIVMLAHDQYFPAGDYTVILYAAHHALPERFLLTGYGWKRERLFTRQFLANSGDGAEWTMNFHLPDSRSVTLAINASAGSEILLDRLSVNKGE